MNTRDLQRSFFVPVTAMLAGVLALALPLAAGGAQRTFVSSSGQDINACSIAAPCRSFGTALAHTDPGGEITVLDSAGYGAVTIAQSVSIIAPSGVYAGVSVFSSFDGVDVNGTGVNVTLRGLSINGQGGNVGIKFQQGARLAIDGCTVSGMMGNGISATAANGAITIADTIARGNGNYGILVTGTLQASIVRSRAEANANAGFAFGDGASVSVADSTAVNNGMLGVHVLTGIAATTQVTLDRLEARGNSIGVLANAVVSGARTVVHVTRANLSQNPNGGLQACCPSYLGIVTASVTDSLVASSDVGIALYAPALSWTVTAGGNRVVDNNVYGFLNFGSAGTFNSRFDNTLAGNGIDTLGTITALFGQ